MALGAADYITKPINVQIARQRIRNLLEREQLRKEVEAHRDRLEELVQQRTAELRNTNKRLSLAQHVAQSSEATIKQLMQQTLRVQENERARLSKELHDEIGQSLTALKLLLRRVQGNCREGAATDCLKEAAAATDDLMREVRSIAYRLRPSQLDELGLLPSLRWHLDKLVRPQGIAATLSGNINEQRLPADIELCCFRVAQEALTNVLRHARASACEVAVNRQGDELALLISDNGAGFAAAGQSDSPASSQTLGLVGMRERIAAVGGKLQINSTPGQGTKILAVFPLPESRS